MRTPLFQGVCTALVTPFTNGRIDYDVYDCLLERQLRAGVEALVVCGTTGEAPTLSDTEKLTLFSHTVQYISGRCTVLAGTGCNCTAHTAELSAAAAAVGVDGLLVVTPYYNKCTQQGLLAHYEIVAASAGIPIVLYNVPSRTGVDIAPETCRVLAQNPLICGIKEANPDVARVSALRHACADDFPIWCGNDDRLTAFYAAGACGVISVLSNLLPEAVLQITNACTAGDYAAAALLQAQYAPLIAALFSLPNPIPVKAALNLTGVAVGSCRLPLTEPEEAALLHLKSVLHAYGLLPS